MLKRKNVDNVISKDSPMIFTFNWSIFIHISGCGHCKAMKPAYMEAAQELRDKNVRIHN